MRPRLVPRPPQQAPRLRCPTRHPRRQATTRAAGLRRPSGRRVANRSEKLEGHQCSCLHGRWVAQRDGGKSHVREVNTGRVERKHWPWPNHLGCWCSGRGLVPTHRVAAPPCSPSRPNAVYQHAVAVTGGWFVVGALQPHVRSGHQIAPGLRTRAVKPVSRSHVFAFRSDPSRVEIQGASNFRRSRISCRTLARSSCRATSGGTPSNKSSASMSASSVESQTLDTAESVVVATQSAHDAETRPPHSDRGGRQRSIAAHSRDGPALRRA